MRVAMTGASGLLGQILTRAMASRGDEVVALVRREAQGASERRWDPSAGRIEGSGLADVDAVCVPGGFGIRGVEGKVGALRYAREHGVPTLGLCLGLQCLVIEAARNLCGLPAAASTEFDPDTAEPVISTIEEQKQFVEGAGNLGGTMRLGLQEATLTDGSVVQAAYDGARTVAERHRHRRHADRDGGLEDHRRSPRNGVHGRLRIQ